jgi:hypothetical protein
VSFAGLTFIQSLHMVTTVEDWPRVRSPSRATRRMRQGHRQNVRILQVPRKDALRHGDKVYIHPETYRELARLIDEQTKAWSTHSHILNGAGT